MKDFLPLAFRELCDRDAGPLGDNPADLIVRHLLVHHREILVLHAGFRLLEGFLHLGQLAVLELGRLVEVIAALRDRDLVVQGFDLLAVGLETLDVLLFIFPLDLLRIESVPELREILLQVREALAAQRVGLLL